MIETSIHKPNYTNIFWESYDYLVNLVVLFSTCSYVVLISVQTGNGSTLRKKGIIVHLMRSCREKEMKFLVRTLVNIPSL